MSPMQNLLDVRGLVTEFSTRSGAFSAVRGLDLSVRAGETVAIVGESGSGKSVTGLSIMRLIDPPRARIAAGSILFRREGGRTDDLALLGESEMRRIRGGEIAMIFQEPMTSLNPAHTVGRQIAEAVRLHDGVSAAAADTRAADMLRLVEIPDPARRARAYPHQLSGGMRQRVMIAMALSGSPDLLLADEPTTALDATVEAQIVSLLEALKRDFSGSIVFISHHLGLVAQLCDDICVMYGGTVVEAGLVADVLSNPKHPYTRALLACEIEDDRHGSRLTSIPGDVPDPRSKIDACIFSPRCPYVIDRCRIETPRLRPAGELRTAACHRFEEIV